MLRLGLTGGIACGKTVAAKIFQRLGIALLDADAIALQLSIQGTTTYDKIVAHFGNSFLDDNKDINRKKLRQEIFEHAQQRKALEAILHPAVRQILVTQTAALPKKTYCVLSIPLLFEERMEDLVDKIVTIECEQSLQIQRLMQRDACTQAQALQAIASQTSSSERRAKAHFIVYNNAGLDALENNIQAIDRQLRSDATTQTKLC